MSLTITCPRTGRISCLFNNGVRVSAIYVGKKKAPWFSVCYNYYHHRVTVTYKKRSFTFDFWSSIANPEMRNRDDLSSALYCSLADAIYGMDDFRDFCLNLGYDDDSVMAHKIWKGCQRAAAKVARVFYDKDIFKLAEYFGD